MKKWEVGTTMIKKNVKGIGVTKKYNGQETEKQKLDIEEKGWNFESKKTKGNS
jgi:hypothetical protein